MKRLVFFIFLVSVFSVSFSQDYEITFSAYADSNVIDSVNIYNVSQQSSMLIPGGATLHLVGAMTSIIAETSRQNYFELYPNPTDGISFLNYYCNQSSDVIISVFDLTGKLIVRNRQVVNKGKSVFEISGLSSGAYSVVISDNNFFSTSQLISVANSNSNASIKFISEELVESDIPLVLKDTQEDDCFEMLYNNGETLLITVYSGIHTSISTLIPIQSQTVLQNIVECIDPNGTSYSTVTIGEQIWMGENLSYDNGCMSVDYEYDTDVGRCFYPMDFYGENYEEYGLLYQWSVVMDGYLANDNNPSGIRGICPEGWHLPSDSEWKELEIELGMLPDQIDLSTSTTYNHRGVDEGAKLSGLAEYWDCENTLNICSDSVFGTSGFNAIPAGYSSNGINTNMLGDYAYFWSGTYYINAPISPWCRVITHSNPRIVREPRPTYNMMSVRCVYDDDTPDTLPTISTNPITDLTSSTAISGGNITSGGGFYVSQRGVVWGESSAPSLEDNIGFTNDGISPGNYISEITGLSGNTEYYVRAYAINDLGTAYGNEVSFITNEVVVPEVTTRDVSDIFLGTAIGGGEVISTGGTTITSRGVVWSTSGNPTIEENEGITYDGYYLGEYLSYLTDLSLETEYSIRAYATNSNGTGYGELKSFSTFDLPQVTTTEITDITSYSASSGGNVIHDGGTNILLRGLVWDTEENPDLLSNEGVLFEGDGTAEFDSYLNVLYDDTTYFVRAFARNSQGTQYGNQLEFTTLGFICNDSLSYENYQYSTVFIADQCWFAENLKYLPEVSNDNYGAYVEPFYYVYGSQSSDVETAKAHENYEKYGVLYNFAAAENACPEGWNLPSTNDWTDLERAVCVGDTCNEVFTYGISSYSYRGANEGSKLAGEYEYWADGVLKNDSEFDTSGFNAVPSGYRSTSNGGCFLGSGTYGIWWANTLCSNDNHVVRKLYYGESSIYIGSNSDQYGYSVRCVLEVLPTIIGFEPTGITQSSCQVVGEVVMQGAGEVTEYGIIYGTSENVSFENDLGFVACGTGVEEFSCLLEELTPQTQYYVRVYATNYKGTAYGEEFEITTNQLCTPSVVTNSVTEINNTTVTLSGNVSCDSICNILGQGFVWDNVSLPNLETSHSYEGVWSELDDYEYELDSLFPETQYYFRAFAYNLNDTVYGDVISIITSSHQLPTIETLNIGYMSQTLAEAFGTIVYSGGSEIEKYGFVWDTVQGATLYNSYDEVIYENFIGDFNSILTGLNFGETYYLRVFAQNQTGIAYGDEIVFETLPQASLPVIITNGASDIVQTNASVSGNLLDNGGEVETIKGFVWDYADNPTLESNLAYSEEGYSEGEFTRIISPIYADTTYYYRAYASNTGGVVYGDVMSFTTLPFPNCGTVEYHDYTYETVQIGEQCWFAENLKYLPSVNTVYDGSAINPKYYVMGYNGTDVNEAKELSAYEIYGVLYNWNAVMQGVQSSNYSPSGVQGVCPSGWHVPSESEWITLRELMGGVYDAGAKLKEIGDEHWNQPTGYGYSNDESTNESGFTALPGGARGESNGTWSSGFDYCRSDGYWWCSTETDEENAIDFHMVMPSTYLGDNTNHLKAHGFSVRCLKDYISDAEVANVETSAVINVTDTSAICVINIIDDGGAYVYESGIVWSLTSNTNIDSNDGVISLSEGEIAVQDFVLDNLMPGQTYYVRAYAINTFDISYGEELSFTTNFLSPELSPCPGNETLIYEGYTYNTVQIGNKCWMAENLRYLPNVYPSDDLSSSNPQYYVTGYEGYSVVDAKNTVEYQKFGALYNLHAALSVCPDGWVLPSQDDWTQLERDICESEICEEEFPFGETTFYLHGTDEGSYLAGGYENWYTGEVICSNRFGRSGFNALPGGRLRDCGFWSSFILINQEACFWSSTVESDDRAWIRSIEYVSPKISRYKLGYTSGLSVRCVKED